MGRPAAASPVGPSGPTPASAGAGADLVEGLAQPVGPALARSGSRGPQGTEAPLHGLVPSLSGADLALGSHVEHLAVGQQLEQARGTAAGEDGVGGLVDGPDVARNTTASPTRRGTGPAKLNRPRRPVAAAS